MKVVFYNRTHLKTLSCHWANNDAVQKHEYEHTLKMCHYIFKTDCSHSSGIWLSVLFGVVKLYKHKYMMRVITAFYNQNDYHNFQDLKTRSFVNQCFLNGTATWMSWTVTLTVWTLTQNIKLNQNHRFKWKRITFQKARHKKHIVSNITDATPDTTNTREQVWAIQTQLSALNDDHILHHPLSDTRHSYRQNPSGGNHK